jgi:hypothetical protein
VFQLLYHQHGGSGLALSLADVMELDFERLGWFVTRLGEQREKEARELERAGRRGRK